MHSKAIPWRSLAVVFLACVLLGFTSSYKSIATMNLFVWLISVGLYSIALFIGFRASQAALKNLDTTFGGFYGFLIFALTVCSGYVGGWLASLALQNII